MRFNQPRVWGLLVLVAKWFLASLAVRLVGQHTTAESPAKGTGSGGGSGARSQCLTEHVLRQLLCRQVGSMAPSTREKDALARVLTGNGYDLR